MNTEDLARKIRKSLVTAHPVLVLLRPTPTGNNVTIRCLSVSELDSLLTNPGKWRDWFIFGVYDRSVSEFWLEDDLGFMIKNEGMLNVE